MAPETTVTDEHDESRADAFVSVVAEISRSQAQKVIESGGVELNGETLTKVSRKVRLGDRVSYRIPEPVALNVEARDIPIDVLHEDSHLIVVNKQPGLVVHPAPGHLDDTLVNALLFHISDLSGIGGTMRPGIVHRLDRYTSGVMVVAKSDAAHQGLSLQFAEHSVERRYEALVVRLRGPGLDESGVFETLHGRHARDRKRYTGRVDQGRRAVTYYRTLERFGSNAVKVECRLETGRTHQIRVHFSEFGCPLLGDLVYGGRAMKASRLIGRQALHARTLGFEHPVTKQRLRFEGEFPEDFKNAEDTLRRGGNWR